MWLKKSQIRDTGKWAASFSLTASPAHVCLSLSAPSAAGWARGRFYWENQWGKLNIPSPIIPAGPWYMLRISQRGNYVKYLKEEPNFLKCICVESMLWAREWGGNVNCCQKHNVSGSSILSTSLPPFGDGSFRDKTREKGLHLICAHLLRGGAGPD